NRDALQKLRMENDTESGHDSPTVSGSYKSQQGLRTVEFVVRHEFDVESAGDQCDEATNAILSGVMHKGHILRQPLWRFLVLLTVVLWNEHYERIAENRES